MAKKCYRCEKEVSFLDRRKVRTKAGPVYMCVNCFDLTKALMMTKDPDRAKALISKGADVNLTLKGWGAIHFAAMFGDVPVATVLMEHGADVNAKTGQGQTALLLAEQKGKTEMAQFLRQHGAS